MDHTEAVAALPDLFDRAAAWRGRLDSLKNRSLATVEYANAVFGSGCVLLTHEGQSAAADLVARCDPPPLPEDATRSQRRDHQRQLEAARAELVQLVETALTYLDARTPIPVPAPAVRPLPSYR